MRREIQYHLAAAGLSQQSCIAQNAACVLRCDGQAQPRTLARHLTGDAQSAIDATAKGPASCETCVKISLYVTEKQTV